MQEASNGWLRRRSGRQPGRLFKVLGVALVVAAMVAFVRRRIIASRGRFEGAMYRLLGRHPDPNVDAATLADRVRSQLGRVEKRLDLPRVHVMVDGRVVHLHGDVEWPHEEATIIEAVRQVAGVEDVQSHLALGMLRSDTRPSQGHLRIRGGRA